MVSANRVLPRHSTAIERPWTQELPLRSVANTPAGRKALCREARVDGAAGTSALIASTGWLDAVRGDEIAQSVVATLGCSQGRCRRPLSVTLGADATSC